MHSVQVILGGFALWTSLLLARSMCDLRAGDGALYIVFCALWFAAAVVNMAIGIYGAGYSFAEELPYFLLVFGVPVMGAASSVMMCRGR
ncbi:hypothetical protein [Herbaspirillum rhizosphaerae]|uniref:hypothetical protein n=1 Tax=Herbaspirillum rhizosphaerae TaxID=346179 RepID=UPI00067D8DF2|nr:hypothetical protein [Herbaspirillum rhizosphaerae]